MNLLVKINGGALLFLAVLLFACEQNAGGLVLDADNNTTVKLAEFNLKSRNIIIDSLRTDSENTGVVGEINHPQFGDITSIANMEFGYGTGPWVADTLQYDSVLLFLNITDYTILPPDSLLQFTIHASDERIYNSAVYLSNRSLELSNRPDTMQVKAKSKGRTVRMKLSRFGNILFEQQKALLQSSYTSFRSTMIIAPVEDSNHPAFVFNLQSDSSFIMLYTSYDTIKFQHRFRFTPQKFNTVLRDRSNSTIENYNNLDTFSIVNQATYINPLFGVMTQVDLDPLIEFADNIDNIIINKAEIKLNSHVDNVNNVFGFRYYFHNENTGIKGEGIFSNPTNTLILSNEGYLSRSQSSVLPLIALKDGTGRFSNDLTLFTEVFYSLNNDQSELLTRKLVLVSQSNLTINEAVLNQNEISLKVYYTTLK